MALVDTTWYCNAGDQSTTGHYAVAKRVSGAAVVAGQLVRQFTAPTVGNERVFVCIVAGTVAVATDATWVLTRGAKTVDGTATWMECTGQAGLNGDLTNTQTWAAVKAATPAVLGQIIKRSNNASYQICTTAGAMSASEPAFSDTAGTTTTDTTAVWTSLGVVGNFTGGQAPFARIGSVFGTNWFAAGNTIYVGNNHAESQVTANTTITTIGNTSGAIAKVLCHTASGPYPPTTTTTGATVTSGNFTVNITLGGSLYCEGIAFRSAMTTSSQASIILTSSGAGANQAWAYYKNCSFQITGAGLNCYMQIGLFSASAYISYIFDNCMVKFGAVTQYMFFCNGQFLWKNTGTTILEAGSSVPTSLISFNASITHDIILEALDLSQLTGNVIGFPAIATGAGMGSCLVKDCKLNAAGTIATPLETGYTVQLVRSSA